MNKKQEIIQKIRECCPETMELKFGTVVQDKEQDDYQIVGCSGGCSKHKKCKSQFETCVYTNLYSLVREPNYSEDCGLISKDVISEEIENGYEIIGTELHLEHLLRTIPNIDFGKLRKVNNTLVLFRFSLSTLELSPFVYYNLSLSLDQNLDNENLCNFIYKLIFK